MALQRTTVAVHGPRSRLDGPTDIEFDPNADEIFYVTNSRTDSVSLFNLSAAEAGGLVSEVRADRARFHYMANVSSIAFNRRKSAAANGDNTFATCQDSVNTYNNTKAPNYFMGPTLFNASAAALVERDGSSCAHRHSNGENCTAAGCFYVHIDMLHESPLCTGIAHDPENTTTYGNVYWAVGSREHYMPAPTNSHTARGVGDPLQSSLIRYDFDKPHGPGSLDHSLADIRRFPEVQLTRVAGVPSHLQVSESTRSVLVSDTGADRVLAVMADGAVFNRSAKTEFNIFSSTAPTFQYSIYTGAGVQVFADNVPQPSGLLIVPAAAQGGVGGASSVFVSSFSTGYIYCFRLDGTPLGRFDGGAPGIAGMALGPGRRLYYVNKLLGTVTSVDLAAAAAAAAAASGTRRLTEADNEPEPEPEEPGPVLGPGEPLEDNRRLGQPEPEPPTPTPQPTPWPTRVPTAGSGSDPSAPAAPTLAPTLRPTPALTPAPTPRAGYENIDAVHVKLCDRTDCHNLDFDGLLMSGCLCHPCLPDPCADSGGVCTNLKPHGLHEGTYSYVGGTLCTCKATSTADDAVEPLQTLLPTPRPTPAPALPAEATATISTTLVVSGLSLATFDFAAQTAVMNALAALYKVSALQVRITNVRAARRLASPGATESRRLGGGSVQFDVQVVSTRTSALVVAADMSAGSASLSGAIRSSLSALGRPGEYALSSASAPELAASPRGTAQCDRQNTLTTGQAVAIAVGSGVMTAVFAFSCWWCWKCMSPPLPVLPPPPQPLQKGSDGRPVTPTAIYLTPAKAVQVNVQAISN
jgi:hypothetical protein